LEGRRFRVKSTGSIVLIVVALLSIGLYWSLFRKSSVLSVSAVEEGVNVGVYWDESCTQRVASIDWGALGPGSSSGVVVHVRNEGSGPYLLTLTTHNWQPDNAPAWLDFSWNCENRTVVAGQVVEVDMALHVAWSFPGNFSGFGFGIVFEGREYIQGDFNKDGDVNLGDLIILASAFGTSPGNPQWNPVCDLDGDGAVGLYELGVLSMNYGKTIMG
jgi:hypothetical protein